MARRATLDRGMPPAAGDESLPPDPAPAKSRRPTSRPSRGSGGRWLIWVARGVLWVVLLVIGYRGVTAIIAGPTPATPAATPAGSQSATTFPATLAQAYALEFGNVYLNFSPATAARRAATLAAYLPPGSDDQLGWNGLGTAHLESEQVASVAVRGQHSAIVTLLAEVNSQMIELGVPVYAAGGKIVISGEPAILPAPGRAALPVPAPVNTDQTTTAALQNQLPPFFRAYASGDQNTLGRFLAPGAQVTGLNGVVTLGSVASVTVPYGGATRDITVVVNWNLSSASSATHSPTTSTATPSLTTTYRMTVVRQGTSWYVQSIGAAAQSPGPP
jgi:hypothetical protein